ncbi:hypothetical protein DPM19_28860 [Actinomadura craniellae]|uniref:Uncharacterized protein n=1 Tax=Actinomadura craniellae TaxID=2231787 RepID=A0A365GXT7_9ACTN|nr:hypothetical protein [Actinomadura craniellae]RAY11640.1 hypothetical protein DPM19_28860 [Actinomadura craniellae]
MPKVKDPLLLREYAVETIVGYYGLKVTEPAGVKNWCRKNAVLRYLREKEDRPEEVAQKLTEADVDPGDVDDLATWLLSDYLPLWDLGGYDKVLDNLAAKGGEQRYITYLRGLNWPKKPRILGGFVMTTGNFSADSLLIRISMDLPDATEILDTILFECCNAFQVEAFKAAKKTFLEPGKRKPELYGARVAEIEYDSDKKHIEHLHQIYGTRDPGALLNALSVPQNLQTAQPYVAGDIGKVVLPARDALPRQSQRQALWWFKTAAWPEDARKLAWISANHGDELARSTDLYRLGSVQKINT